MGGWEPTRWTLLGGFGEVPDAAAYRQAWDHLFASYRPVFVAYVAFCLRRMGGHTLASNEAEEVVDQFLADCHAKGWLTRPDREKGRFRTYMRKVLAWYTKDFMARRGAQKRMPAGGPARQVEDLAAVVGVDNVAVFQSAMDTAWMGLVVARALTILEDRNPRYARAIRHVVERGGADRALLALHLEASEKQVPILLYRARRMFAEELWGQVKETCGSEAAYTDERRALRPWLEGYLDAETHQSLFGELPGPA